jgi:F-type H+-transporting ATPase subunit epsilon
MALKQQLRIVLVTPETTLLDEPVEALRFPLYDGQIGILPGRAPLVARVGYGELQITTAAGKKSYFVDGGFVQVKQGIVSLLTNRAQTADSLDARDAEDELQVARQRLPTTDADFAEKAKELMRARRKLALARKAH